MAYKIAFNKQSRIIEHLGLQRGILRYVINSVATDHGFHVEQLHYVFVDDETLIEINQEFLQHNYYTDIITFDLSDTSGSISGEIYISNDRVLDNAIKLSVSPKEELLRVMIHGVLHLSGYKDKTKQQKLIMRLKENEYIAHYKERENAARTI